MDPITEIGCAAKRGITVCRTWSVELKIPVLGWNAELAHAIGCSFCIEAANDQRTVGKMHAGQNNCWVEIVNTDGNVGNRPSYQLSQGLILGVIHERGRCLATESTQQLDNRGQLKIRRCQSGSRRLPLLPSKPSHRLNFCRRRFPDALHFGSESKKSCHALHRCQGVRR